MRIRLFYCCKHILGISQRFLNFFQSLYKPLWTKKFIFHVLQRLKYSEIFITHQLSFALKLINHFLQRPETMKPRSKNKLASMKILPDSVQNILDDLEDYHELQSFRVSISLFYKNSLIFPLAAEKRKRTREPCEVHPQKRLVFICCRYELLLLPFSSR